MRIGYPCINQSLECRVGRTFRLASYSEERLIETVSRNLDCLEEILAYNVEHGMLFFRIASDIVPFASHPVNEFDWQEHFRERFEKVGSYIRSNGFRISMHPDQFNVLNSPKQDVVERTFAELIYQCEVLDLMKLDSTAKLQIHLGGAYGDKGSGIKRFARRYERLDERLKQRLVVENDDKSYTVEDCMELHEICGIPVLYDHFHHICNGGGEPTDQMLHLISDTWVQADGDPMVDYSSQLAGGKKGQHTESIDLDDFSAFLQATEGIDFDVMLEIKDKQASALKAIEAARSDPRFSG